MRCVLRQKGRKYEKRKKNIICDQRENKETSSSSSPSFTHWHCCYSHTSNTGFERSECVCISVRPSVCLSVCVYVTPSLVSGKKDLRNTSSNTFLQFPPFSLLFISLYCHLIFGSWLVRYVRSISSILLESLCRPSL